jgi:hypothetical protein
MSGQVSLGSTPCGHNTKNWLHLEKSLARQTEQGLDLSRQKPQMFYELGTQCPQSWALGWELLGENPDYLSELVHATLVHDGFECSSPWDYVRTKFGLVWGQNLIDKLNKVWNVDLAWLWIMVRWVNNSRRKEISQMIPPLSSIIMLVGTNKEWKDSSWWDESRTHAWHILLRQKITSIHDNTVTWRKELKVPKYTIYPRDM